MQSAIGLDQGQGKAACEAAQGKSAETKSKADGPKRTCGFIHMQLLFCDGRDGDLHQGAHKQQKVRRCVKHMPAMKPEQIGAQSRDRDCQSEPGLRTDETLEDVHGGPSPVAGFKLLLSLPGQSAVEKIQRPIRLTSGTMASTDQNGEKPARPRIRPIGYRTTAAIAATKIQWPNPRPDMSIQW
jgi:hypothetical protein